MARRKRDVMRDVITRYAREKAEEMSKPWCCSCITKREENQEQVRASALPRCQHYSESDWYVNDGDK